MTEWRNRLALRTDTQVWDEWEFRYMNITDIKGGFGNEIKAFSPIMMRSLSSVLDIAGDTQEAHLDGQVWPTLLIDFGQWRDSIDITGYLDHGETGDAYTLYQKFSTFLRWIKRGQANYSNQMFLQLYVKNTFETQNPRCGFDPIDTPYFVKEGYGFPGLVSDVQITKHPAGDGSIEFSLKFMVGRVVPI